MRRSSGIVLTLLLAAVFARPAWAVIQVLIPLQSLIGDSDGIVVAKVEKVDPTRPAAVLVVTQSLKGKLPLQRLPINLTGDEEKHTPQLLKRLATDLPVVLCVKKQDAKTQMVLAFTNGTWFQVLGKQDGADVRWSFTHCEPYLRRTFKGTTAELEKIVADSVAGKKKAPPPNPKEPPGFGPEVAAADGSGAAPAAK